MTAGQRGAGPVRDIVSLPAARRSKRRRLPGFLRADANSPPRRESTKISAMPVTRERPFRYSTSLRVFLAGCLLSAVAAATVDQWVKLATARQIEDEASSFESNINARIAGHVALLRGAAGLFATRSWVTHEDFARYFSQIEVTRNYAGVQGVGLSYRIDPPELAAFGERARHEGLASFRVWPAEARPEYHAILYLEPEDVRNRAAIGYDMHTEAVRRAAMDQARDTGQPAVTGKVVLVQEIDAAKQAGFLIYFPFYRDGTRPGDEAARREQLAGFAYAAFRAGNFVNAIVDSAALRNLGLAVFDGTRPEASDLIFRTPGGMDPASGAVVTRTRTMRVLNRPWTLVYTLDAGTIVSPWTVVLFGLVLSAGATFLSLRAERARHRAETSEARTREREGELALLIDAVPALVSYIDAQGVFRLCNRRLADWFGLEPGGIVGQNVANVIGPDLFAAIEPQLKRALAGESVSFERWYRLPGMTNARYLGTTYVPHRLESGQVSGVYSLTADLTTHKRAEEAAHFMADCGKLLIASMDFESTTRGLVHLAVPRVADVAVLFRAERDKLQANAVAHVDGETERRLGEFLQHVALPIGASHNIALAARTGLVVVSSELNESDLERAAADDAQRHMLRALQLRSALHVPVIVRGNIWAVYSFGTSVISGRQFTDEHRQLAEEIATRVRLAVENALLFREAQQEIEERRRAERVTRETEERFSLLVEGVRDYAIMALDADGNIESWNEGGQRILGFAERDAIGMAAAKLYTAEDRASGVPEQELTRAREGGAASDERWFVRHDGSRLWASSHTVALRHDDGGLRGYARIMRDLTDRKRIEEELERRVQARTLELNEAVHELEAFSYSVSHDLRAPLRTIRGFTELAIEEADGRLTEDERGYLDRVRRASSRLDRLISDLLAYTRVSKTKVELRPVQLQALVSDIQREHPEFQAPQADVRLEGALLPVIGNEAYLTQCVTNLLGNAVKFVQEGEKPVVRIWTERRDAMVRLYVRDEGIGIPPEQLSRAFEMFERLHTTGSYEGTGVGLAIVRRAVQRMKGTVGVDSKVGEGTTFWIELPAA